MDSGVLRAVALPLIDTEREGCFDLARFDEPVHVALGSGCEHVAIGRGARSLRLDVLTGAMFDAPSFVELHIDFGSRLRPQAATLARLLALHRDGSLSAWRPPHDPRFARLVTALRALDALHAGASLRRIGELLLTNPAGDWPGRGESVKSRTRRLVDLARQMERLGPRAVLAVTV